MWSEHRSTARRLLLAGLVAVAAMASACGGGGGTTALVDDAGSGSTGGTGNDAGSDAALDSCAALSARLQAALDEDVDVQSVPGAAAQVVTPSCTWTGATGLAIRAMKTPMTADAQLFVASITKTFTAAVVLQLAAEGKLVLDDQVTKYVPDFPDATGVTVRQLLNHTSGLFDYSANPDFGTAVAADYDREWKQAEILAFAAGKPRTNASGVFHYSATNTFLAGMVIEKVTGSTVTREFRARIFEPLQLSSTWHAGFEAPATGSLSHGYYNGQDVTALVRRKSICTSSWTTGSLVSTVGDLGRFFDALLVKRTLLPPAQLAEMEQFVVTDDLFRDLLQVPGYGLGLVRRTTSIGDGLGNGGASSGWLVRSFWIAERKVQITVFINSGTNDVDETFDALINVIDS